MILPHMQPIVAHAPQLISGARSAVKYAGPSLALRFDADDYRVGPIGSQPAASTLAGLVTFTRASGGGRFNASGNYEYLGNDVPRLDYDPVTLQPRGILIEEQRTNLQTQSADFSSGWSGAGLVMPSNAGTCPDGATSGKKLVVNTGVPTIGNDANGGISRPLTVSASAAWTFSVFVKAAEVSSVRVRESVTTGARAKVDLISGAVTYETGTRAQFAVSAEKVGSSGWWRIICTRTTGSSETTHRVFIKPGIDTGDGVSGIYIWGAQLEQGAFPTSYIPTTTAQVTRAADVAVVNNLSPWYRSDEGTLFVDVYDFNGNSSRAVTLHNGTINEQIWLRTAPGDNFSGYKQGVFQWQTVIESASGKLAGAYKVNDVAAARGGGTVVTDTNAVIPSVSFMRVGASWDGGVPLNGHIRSIKYYPRRMTNAELQALTA